ncbi:cytochrome b [Mucilaginibacter pocheonensis]|uniref:Cytochrome b n=2 Tax=Mucilaginibacter pocheonensis TaxID=398050 RepID=A0ABU1TEE4_9SPHI|nr:cytochrome b [Mucilaginibacter pocheonensis]
MLVLSGSLLTVVITATVMKTSGVSNLLKEGLAKSGINIKQEVINSTAQRITDSFWFLHLYFGYALTALLMFRLLLECFQMREQKLIRSLKKLAVIYKSNHQNYQARHLLIVKIIYMIFYLALIVMVCTGLFIGYGTSLSFYNAVIGPVRAVHSAGFYFMLIFIFTHLCGVYLAEKGRSPGIVSGMIHGKPPVEL